MTTILPRWAGQGAAGASALAVHLMVALFLVQTTPSSLPRLPDPPIFQVINLPKAQAPQPMAPAEPIVEIPQPMAPAEPIVESPQKPPPPVEAPKLRSQPLPKPKPRSKPEPAPTPKPEPVAEAISKPEPLPIAPPEPAPLPQAQPVVTKKTKNAPPPPPAYVPPLSNVAGMYNPKPPYPALARRRGWQGLVLLTATVNKSGNVMRVIIKKSSGHRLLDQVAMRTVKKWCFKPAQRGGLTVMAKVDVPIRFNLAAG